MMMIQMDNNNDKLVFGEWPMTDVERKILRERIRNVNEKAHLVPPDPRIARQEAKQARAKARNKG